MSLPVDMPHLIAYIDLITRRLFAEEEDLTDELDAAWRLLTMAERHVANHVAKLMAGHMGHRNEESDEC